MREQFETGRASLAVARMKDRGVGVGDNAARAAEDRAKCAATSANEAFSAAGDFAAAPPDVVREQAKGNPVAAGPIAFGIGWLVSLWALASDAETKAAASVQDTTQDAAPRTARHARSAASDVQEHAQSAMNQVAGVPDDRGRAGELYAR